MTWTACKVFIAIALLTGCIYPLLITEIATIAMPHQANGSLIFHNGQLRGSKLIAQPFIGEKYFWPRPSVMDYNALRSYGSNLGPTSRKLQELVRQRAQKYLNASSDNQSIPVELLYASGSGLDPHISVKAVHFQLERVARARSLNAQDQEKLRELIHQFIEGQPELLGPRHVNVLLLNIALDQTFSPDQQS
jgi:potassium-transporting ATPase KdpC subunit